MTKKSFRTHGIELIEDNHCDKIMKSWYMVNSGDVVSSGEIVTHSNTLDIRGPLLQDMWQRQASERSGLSSFVFSSSADVHDITFYTLVHNSHKWLLGEKLICPPAKYAICYWFLKCCVKQCSIMTWLDKVSALWFLKEQCYSFSLLHERLEQFVKFVALHLLYFYLLQPFVLW